MPKATVGRIVHYALADNDLIRIKAPFYQNPNESNPMWLGQIVPAIVVWPHDDEPQTFNGQAFLDGNFTLGLTSVPYSEEPKPGTWHWPPIAGS